MQAIREVVIVGGGTAGWLSAAFLARQLNAGSAQGVRITVVESSDIPIIGVGEGTFPSIRGTLSLIGIDEARFVRECHATFKQGIRFVDWLRPPGEQGRHSYFHPFSVPSQRPGGLELLPYWLMGDAGPGAAFAQAATLQQTVVDACHGPKRVTDADYTGPMNYAYHFDAGRFAALLAQHAQTLGVHRVVATVEQVLLDAQGAIAQLVTREAGTLQADLYVDCTGFRGTLIGQALGSPWRSVDDVLFTDRALALQVAHDEPGAPLASCTISTAHSAGWTWDIGLQQRRGVGHVYASRYCSDEQAEQTLRAHVGPAAEGLSVRKLAMQVGYREQPWVKNCVAIGLSGGFLEPLEASGIGLIETAAYLLGFLFPFNGDTAPAARQFNTLMTARFERIVDFLKLHYCLSQRQDSAFWRDNIDPASWTDSLRDKLCMWRSRPPHRLDFVTDLEMYPPSSWQYVLYGMDFKTELGRGRAAWPHAEAARQEFRTLAEVAQRALRDLPSHRALVDHLCARP
jgi:tryptophan 7-halogenase